MERWLLRDRADNKTEGNINQHGNMHHACFCLFGVLCEYCVGFYVSLFGLPAVLTALNGGQDKVNEAKQYKNEENDRQGGNRAA